MLAVSVVVLENFHSVQSGTLCIVHHNKSMHHTRIYEYECAIVHGFCQKTKELCMVALWKEGPLNL